MESEILLTIIRESVSLGILIIVLVGGYRIANKIIDLIDQHLSNIERQVTKIVELIEEYTDA
jgi:hypothetical protein